MKQGRIIMMSKNIAPSGELFSEVNAQLSVFSNALICKLESQQFESQALARKWLSQLSTKIYRLLSDKGGSAKEVQQNRDIFLKIVQSHLTNFLNNQAILRLLRCSDDYNFAQTLARAWTDYKRIVFSFFSLFLHAKDYFQTARLTEANRLRANTPAKQDEHALPLPIPAAAVILFEKLVLRRFQLKIRKVVLSLMMRERELSEPSNAQLTLIFQAIWSCSLKELARIAISKDAVYFHKEERKDFTLFFKDAARNEDFIEQYILNDVARAAALYYTDLTQSLRLLNGVEQMEMINFKCELEEQIARFHLPSKASISYYLNAVYKQLILADFEEILAKPLGFKHVISNFSHTSSEHEKEVQLFFRVIRRVESNVIDQVIKVIDALIVERGAEIKEKLNKPKEFMTDMLHFKKSFRKIFAIVETDTLKVEVAMEKGFKNLMEGFEVSKSLAEFTDYTIRQCSRLKLDETSSEQKLKEVIFMLTSVSAKDLFLAYHQESMAKRLLDSLNEPKLEPELLLLRLLADNLGNILLSPHFSMVKDIQSSIDVTDNLSKILPFINYKWDLKVLNTTVWPDSTLRIRFSHITPPSFLQQHLYQLQDLYKQYRGFALQWKLDRGISLFEGRFSKGKYRFQAENIYMMVLLYFNDNPVITFAELSKLIASQKRQNQKNSHLQIILKVLVENKLIIRPQETASNDTFDQSQTLRINMQYSPGEQTKPGQTVFIKMSAQLAKSLNQNNMEVNKVIKDRQKLVDALLVKFLKHAHSTGNNRITFLELYEGVRNNPYLSNFNFTQTAVKERLEQLVSKEYCRRDEEDRRVYHYIA